MNKKDITRAFQAISATMAQNVDILTELDAKFGDGDLGVSMKSGFAVVSEYALSNTEVDLGILLKGCSIALNKAAPSTLGTILSFGLMGMAKSLKGLEEADLSKLSKAMRAGLELIMERGNAKPGDKTVLDSLFPAVETLAKHADRNADEAFSFAYQAAQSGAEATKGMTGKHGRVAYFGDKTLGETDSGAMAGGLIFKALAECARSEG